ncbi:leucyl/phenylalanyl-tRNA--protein transferase [Aliiglaciecola sp. CAU 1673]|uniref:leucyl/phenylalanyl-tRNA--protein transferase n=1 Tax=Aliiglaciecola sp. CAU 1673 TaxID=3032595 RepID=UPI0023DA7271|nr:leucyl/phenylalanyl-tRNA--protein transferase [Aliiglaciecola sp. CAU 1673]MDF2177711.1 leucyl/phenylalanyl-tRNA--protein transferase [Aliiglaciecola sp. CAU 1673]
MQEQFIKLDHRLRFPRPDNALIEPDGLLAFGGDLSVKRLLLAYQNGIFPWFSEGEPILWWSPSKRGILELKDFYCSKSLAKLARSGRYRASLNLAFDRVIEACASTPRGSSGTWITKQMIAAYQAVHRAGYAHSVEIWEEEELVGGLYGLGMGKVFCGESMFHLRTDASKLAMLFLVNHLLKYHFDFIDCQLQNPHLASLGATEIPRQQFLKRLHQSAGTPAPEGCWTPQSIQFIVSP